MKTKCYPVYEFDELPADIQDKAVEELQYCNVEDGWWDDFMIEEWQEKLATMGYEDAEIEYSGFSSQGDGACFKAGVNALTWFKAHKGARTELRALYRFANKGSYIKAEVSHSGRYSHAYSMDSAVELDGWGESPSDKVQLQAEQLQRWILEDARELANKIYRELEQEYEYCTTRESIIETIKANEWTFNARGHLDNIPLEEPVIAGRIS